MQHWQAYINRLITCDKRPCSVLNPGDTGNCHSAMVIRTGNSIAKWQSHKAGHHVIALIYDGSSGSPSCCLSVANSARSKCHAVMWSLFVTLCQLPLDVACQKSAMKVANGDRVGHCNFINATIGQVWLPSAQLRSNDCEDIVLTATMRTCCKSPGKAWS